MFYGLTAIDWLVVAAYFAVVAGVAAFVSRRSSNTRDYFLGSRGLPWWASSLSIIATETSAVTFIGVPYEAYGGDWSLLQLVIGFVFGRVFLAAYFVRAFYQHADETVYAFLGRRFGRAARATAGALFLGGRVIASGVRLLAGCLALGVAIAAASPEADLRDAVAAATIALGIFGTAFTLVGGIRAVVWTDVVLGLTFVAAAAGSAVYMLAALSPEPSLAEAPPFTLDEFLNRASVIHLSIDLSDGRSLLAGVLGGFFLTLATHGTDQDIAQRMLTGADARAGRLSVLGSAVLIGPLFTLFLVVGTLLYFYYGQHPPSYPMPSDRNALFPAFIIHELPAGFTGFVVAGLLAASLSSLTSALNALAATTICDLYRPWRERSGARPLSDAHYVWASRAATVGWGIALILTALALYGSDQSLVPFALSVLTYFYGGLLGAFLLGLFTSRGGAVSVPAGMVLSIPAVVALQTRQFIDHPERAPELIRGSIERLAATYGEAIRSAVPDISWHYWLIVAAAITFAVGLVGAPARESR